MIDVEERERQRRVRVAQNFADMAPIVAALREAGLAIDTISDLPNKKLDYRKAIPI